MKLIEKAEPAIIISAIIIGLMLANINIIAHNSGYLINIFLCLMLYAVFLEIPLKDLKNSFKNHKYTLTTLIINFIWTPLLGYLLANLFLGSNLDLIIGFFMLILTPCTDWYLIFTKMAKGDVGINLSILPINLILQIILLPVYLIIFFTQTNSIDYTQILYSLIIVIIIPFVMSGLTKVILNADLKNRITGVFSNFQTVFLSLAIVSIFASQGGLLFRHFTSLIIVFIPLIIFFTVNMALAYLVSRRLNFTYGEYAGLTMTTLARNSPLALAIAINSFPNNVLISMVLVIGPLIELPILYIVSKICLKLDYTD